MDEFVEIWNSDIKVTFNKYLSLSEPVGSVVMDQAKIVKEAFDHLGSIIELASKFKKPASQEEFGKLIEPLAKSIQRIQALRDENRAHEYFFHLSTISESIAAFSWVVVELDPSKFVKEHRDAGAYFGNKVMVEFKTKNPTHVEWAKTWLETLTKLSDYIRTYHRTGLTWNQKSTPATAASQNTGNVPPPPMPPPPVPPSAPTTMPDAQSSITDNFANLLKEINKGSEITKCLKHTPKGSVRSSTDSVIPTSCGKLPPSSHQPANVRQYPPVFQLDSRKWRVEHQKNQELTVSPDMTHTVYVYKCDNSMITVTEKATGIVLDSCKSISLLCHDVISSVEFINCSKVKAQTLGAMPTLSIDKSENVQVYLCEKALNVQIVSEKSSELNILVPKGDDYVEYSVPEQMKSVFEGGKLNTYPILKM